MKTLSFTLFSLLLACHNKINYVNDNIYKDQDNNIIYSQDNISIKFTTLNSNKIKFVLNAKEYGFINYTKIAKLVLFEDLDGKMIVPEGTNRIDYNNPKDIIGIKCDSTYSFSIDTLHIAIALENFNHNRMDFQLESNGENKISISKTLIKEALN